MDDGLEQFKRIAGYEIHRVQCDFVYVPFLPIPPAAVHEDTQATFLALEGE